jgi:hypothetical protein
MTNGGLISYGVNLTAIYRRAASYIFAASPACVARSAVIASAKLAQGFGWPMLRMRSENAGPGYRNGTTRLSALTR